MKPPGRTSIRINGPSCRSTASLGQARRPPRISPVVGICWMAFSISGTQACWTNQTAVAATKRAKTSSTPSNRQRLAMANRATPPNVNGCQASFGRSFATSPTSYPQATNRETQIRLKPPVSGKITKNSQIGTPFALDAAWAKRLASSRLPPPGVNVVSQLCYGRVESGSNLPAFLFGTNGLGLVERRIR